jgi:hypothetical protein
MPRGIKGSGKSRKTTTEPGQPRRRGRKLKDRIPEVVQPAESPPAEPLTIEPPLAEAPLADAPATGEPDPETSTPVPAPEQLPEVLPYTPVVSTTPGRRSVRRAGPGRAGVGSEVPWASVRPWQLGRGWGVP